MKLLPGAGLVTSQSNVCLNEIAVVESDEGIRNLALASYASHSMHGVLCGVHLISHLDRKYTSQTD